MRKHIVIIVFCFFSILLSGIPAFASQADVSVIKNIKDVLDGVQYIGKDLYFIEDQTDQYSFDDITKLSPRQWQKSLVSTPNFGYTDSSYWFRATLRPSGKSLDKLLAIQYSLLDHIELYVAENGQLIQRYITGDTFNFSERPIRHRDFLFPVQFKTNQDLDLYIKVKTEGSLQLPISLWDRGQFIWQDQDEQFIKAIYYGMLLLLIVYNLFLFL